MNLEGNKIIAQFMGGTIEPPLNIWIFPKETEPPYALMALEQFKYHCSWDWLMPAWFKFQDTVETMEAPFRNYREGIQQSFMSGIDAGEILLCYSALLEGINWYNKQTK